MKNRLSRPIIRQILTSLVLIPSITACTNKFSFEAVTTACEPPATSARYGKNEGPVITAPNLGALTNGRLIVSGTCVDGQDVLVNGAHVKTPVNASCTVGVFAASIELIGSDGRKQVDVSQKNKC